MIAAAVQALESGGYTSVRPEPSEASTLRVFEDPYGIVGLASFETWRELAEAWPEAQAQMTTLMARYLARPDPKSWEGYLVLLTPNPTPSEHADATAAIRYDTSRLRKLVITGDQAASVSDVIRYLSPVLPLVVNTKTGQGAALLEQLPELLEPHGVEPSTTQTVISAFTANEPIVERLHRDRRAR